MSWAGRRRSATALGLMIRCAGHNLPFEVCSALWSLPANCLHLGCSKTVRSLATFVHHIRRGRPVCLPPGDVPGGQSGSPRRAIPTYISTCQVTSRIGCGVVPHDGADPGIIQRARVLLAPGLATLRLATGDPQQPCLQVGICGYFDRRTVHANRSPFLGVGADFIPDPLHQVARKSRVHADHLGDVVGA